jgi:hypothetical protein
LKLHANHADSYADIEELDLYLAQRICQAFEMGKFINETSQTADLIIALGDFNMTPDELGFKILKNNANLLDSFTEAQVQRHFVLCIGYFLRISIESTGVAKLRAYQRGLIRQTHTFR